MCELAKPVRKLSERRWFYSCLECGQEFIGYLRNTGIGANKYCTRVCAGKAQAKKEPMIKRISQYLVDKKKRILERDVIISELHVINPNRAMRSIGEELNISHVTVYKALSKYHKRGGDTVLTLNSGIDTEKAIKQAESYQI